MPTVHLMSDLKSSQHKCRMCFDLTWIAGCCETHGANGKSRRVLFQHRTFSQRLQRKLLSKFKQTYGTEFRPDRKSWRISGSGPKPDRSFTTFSSFCCQIFLWCNVTVYRIFLLHDVASLNELVKLSKRRLAHRNQTTLYKTTCTAKFYICKSNIYKIKFISA